MLLLSPWALERPQVEVYFNLHEYRFSVRDASSKLVIGHADKLCLEGVVFHVSQAGRQRVLREGRKNVHAWLRGTLRGAFTPEEENTRDEFRVRYNPKTGPLFLAQHRLLGSEPLWLPVAGAGYAELEMVGDHPLIVAGGLKYSRMSS